MKANDIKSVTRFQIAPHSVTQLEKIKKQDSLAFDEFYKILIFDPFLMVNTLKTANSPLYGFSKKIYSIKDAIELHGLSSTKGMIISNYLQSGMHLDLHAYGIHAGMLIIFSKMQHDIAQEWYKGTDDEILQLLPFTVFLVDVGKVLISKEIANKNLVDKFLEELKKSQDITASELKITRTTTAEVSATLFENWNFEERLIKLIRASINPKKADNAYKIAAYSMNVLKIIVPLNGVPTEESFDAGINLATKYNLDTTSLKETLEKFRHAIQQED